jgi:hypothetical protein
MFITGHPIRALAMAAVLWVGLSRSGTAQMADTTDALSIETVTVTVYRVREPAKAPIAKAETKGRAPSAGAVWVSGTCRGIETPGRARDGSGCRDDG